MIKSIRIENFKSLRYVDVELTPLTVLIGRSGTGKSNFVDALAFFRDCLVSGETIANRWGSAQRFFCATAPRENAKLPRIIFTVRFDAPGHDSEFRYMLQLVVNGDRVFVFSEDLWYGGVEVFARSENKWVKEPAVIPLPAPNQLALQTANGIPEVSTAYFVLTEGLGCYGFQGTVLQPAPHNNRNQGNSGLADDASNYLQVFLDISRNLQDVESLKQIFAAMRQLSPALKTIQVVMPQRDKVTVSMSAGDKILTLELSQQSEGFRRYLAHLIAIYQFPPKQLLIFDEPEKGLYPGALSALAEQFRSCPSAGRGQVILTTHNPALLDHFQPEEIRVVDLDRLETRIGPVSTPQVEAVREQLMTTGELLTVDPARFESPSGEPT